MAEVPDDLEKLVVEVRKTISDNKQFLEKLVDESDQVGSDEEVEEAVVEEDFEEL